MPLAPYRGLNPGFTVLGGCGETLPRYSRYIAGHRRRFLDPDQALLYTLTPREQVHIIRLLLDVPSPAAVTLAHHTFFILPRRRISVSPSSGKRFLGYQIVSSATWILSLACTFVVVRTGTRSVPRQSIRCWKLAPTVFRLFF